jgi:hypothetical protein
MGSVDELSSENEPRWHGRLAVLVLIVGTLLAMGRCCTHDFSWWDDEGTVFQNQWMLPPTFQTLIHYWMVPAYGLYIPVTYTVWAAVALIARVDKDQYGIALNPWLFHSTNVSCHLLAVLVAYRILRLLNADVFGACCGALLFGVHPVQVEAVAWVSGLKDVLSGLFALIALWQYVCFSLSDLKGKASAWRYLLATLAFMLAMLAKPSAIALPLAVVAIDRWGVGRSWKKVLPGAIAWVFLAAPIAFVARWVQDASNTELHSIWLRPFIVCDALAFYLFKLIWPIHLAIDYGRNPTYVLQQGWCYWDWVFPVGIAALLITGARKRPVLLAAGAIFLAGCLPVLGFSPALFQYFSTTTDHYLYVSMFGAGMAVAWLLSVRPWVSLRLITVALLIAWTALSIRQTRYWKNDAALFGHDIEINPNSYVGYINLGGDYARDHDWTTAIAVYRKATQVGPDFALAWGDLADALDEAGQSDEAIVQARKAIDLQIQNPNLRQAWPQDNERLGRLLFEKGKYAEAIPFLKTAADILSNDKTLADKLETARKRAATEPSTTSTKPSIPGK